MGSKQFPAGGGNFDSNFVVGRNQRIPGLAQVRLTRHRQNQPLHHRSDCARIGFVTNNRVSVVNRVDHRLLRRRRRNLRKRAANGAEVNQSYVSDRQGTLILWPQPRITTPERRFRSVNETSACCRTRSAISTSTFPFERGFARTAHFTKSCSIARKRRDFVRRFSGSSGKRRRIGILFHRQFISVAARRRR